MKAFVHGFSLSIGLITGLGPQNLFIVSQGATFREFKFVLPVVAIAAICDTILIILGISGTSIAAYGGGWLRRALMMLGVCLLLRISWVTWHGSPSSSDASVDMATWPLKRRILYTLTVSLLNPPALVDTVITIGSTALEYQKNDRMIFAIAAISASWIWYPSLAYTGRILMRSPTLMKRFNKIAALILLASAGALALAAAT